jgi:Na+/proline symporter
VFAIMTNVIVCAMLILGGASVMQALTGALPFWPAARPLPAAACLNSAPTCQAA